MGCLFAPVILPFKLVMSLLLMPIKLSAALLKGLVGALLKVVIMVIGFPFRVLRRGPKTGQ